MTKFYINSISTANEIRVKNGVSITETLDESLDSSSFTLAFTGDKEPLKPRTKVIIVNDNETQVFIVANDSVTVASKNPLTYIHTVTLVQSTRELSNHLIRNSQFAQPSNTKAGAMFHQIGTLKYYANKWNFDYFINYFDDPDGVEEVAKRVVPITKNSKLANGIVSFWYAIGNYESTNESLAGYRLYNFLDWNGAGFELQSIQVRIQSTMGNVTIIKTLNNVLPNSEVTFKLTKSEIEQIEQGIAQSTQNSGEITISVAETGTHLAPKQIVISSDTADTQKYYLFFYALDFSFESFYYTLYDVLEQVRDDYKLEDAVSSRESLFELPTTGEFYTTLKETVAPNFTFTQSTMFDAVSEVCRFLDGAPTLSNDNEIGIEYFNDLSGNKYVFENETTDESIVLSENNYVNKLITYYQNARIENSLFYPSENAYAYPRPRKLGVITTDDWWIDTGNAIDYVVGAKVYWNGFDDTKFKNDTSFPSTQYENETTTVTVFFGEATLPPILKKGFNISSRIFEKSFWSLLPQDYGDNIYIHAKTNTLWYEHGDTGVYVGCLEENINGQTYVIGNVIKGAVVDYIGSFDVSLANISGTDSPRKISMQVEYMPLLNGRVSVEGNETKKDGESLSEQANGNTLLERLGVNMYGLVAKLGVPALSLTTRFKKYSERVKKGDIWTDENGENWIANTVTTTIYNDYCFCRVEFTKNFNKLSNYISVNRAKRFYEISNDLTVKSEDNLIDYLYFTTKESDTENNTPIRMNADGMFVLLGYICQNDNDKNILSKADYALITTSNEGNAVASSIYLPINGYGSGSSICFEMSFNSPVSAGTYLGTEGQYISSTVAKSCFYSTDYGFFDNITINGFISYKDRIITPNENFPNCVNTDYENQFNIFTIQDLKYTKRPNEVFALNYQLTCLSKNVNEVFFGRRFINENSLISNVNQDLSLRGFKLVTSRTHKYSILDTKVVYDNVVSNNAIFESSQINNNVALIQTTEQTSQPCISWAIADESDNIILAFNQTRSSGDTFDFYVFTSNKRL